jgi:hypothetical protein
MTDWKVSYGRLSGVELQKIAILRVMECTNGVIQHAFRDNAEYALPVEETRKAMKFSMGCMKNMEIPLKNGTITFAPQTQSLMRTARELYVGGVKNGNDEDFEEFMEVSAASAQACGKGRILKAKEVLSKNVDAIPAQAYDWGVSYLMQFL